MASLGFAFIKPAFLCSFWSTIQIVAWNVSSKFQSLLWSNKCFFVFIFYYNYTFFGESKTFLDFGFQLWHIKSLEVITPTFTMRKKAWIHWKSTSWMQQRIKIKGQTAIWILEWQMNTERHSWNYQTWNRNHETRNW